MSQNHSCITPGALGLAILLASFSAGTMEIDRIIAVVDESVILQSELDSQMRRVRDQLRQNGSPMPPTSVLEQQLMERLVVEKIQLQLCERMGMNVSDRMLDQAINDIADNNGVTIEQFREILAQENYSYSLFREEIRQQILISELTQREVDARIVVSPNEIDDFLGNQVFQGNSDFEYRMSHILIPAPDTGRPEDVAVARAQAETLLQEIRSGADFATAAANHSAGQQAAEGGDLGWRKADELPTLFTDFVTRAEVGDTSDIISSSSGYHLVRLTDRRSGEQFMVEQTHARHILIQLNELVTEESARTRLAQLKLRLEGGDDFATLARTHSDDRGSALEGGDLGWVSPGQMVPEFEQMMNQAPAGAISPPFETEFGWHILQVLDRRSYDGTDEVRRARAREAIHRRKSEEEYQTWMRQLRDEAYVELRLLTE